MSGGIDIGTHEILDHLTRSGYLVLRVDDRGAGGTVAPPSDASFHDFVADARACVEHLSKREDVDAKRIVLIGHSEGGVTAPILAAERPEIAAIVLMAAPGRPLIDVIMDQNRSAMEKQGLTSDELEKQLSLVRAFLVRVASDEPIDPQSLSSDEERSTLRNRRWLQSHAKQDPLANIKKVKCPVLILQGAKDFQVSPEKDAAALEAALKSVQHPDHELRVLDGLDHLFKKSPGEVSEFGDYWKNRPIDTRFLDALEGWLAERVKRAGG
jgi:pimeloyl-ACP methyl ester carboxylesterase